MTNNLERKSCIFSAAASAVCFILMLVIFAFVKFEPPVKYKTIIKHLLQITMKIRELVQ